MSPPAAKKLPEEHPALVAARNAPLDDEPETDEERAAIEEAIEDERAGRVFTLDEVLAELGLTREELARVPVER